MEFPRITSAVNPRIKEAVRIRERKNSKEEKLFVIEGPHIIETALEANVDIHEVFFTDRFESQSEGVGLLEALRAKSANIFSTTGHLLNKITDTEAPQGIAAIVSFETSSIDGLSARGNPLYLVSDGIQEPGNLGTIIRTADAAGCDAVILLEGTCDVFIPKAIRATAGSIFHLPVAYAKAETFLKWIQKTGILLTATSADAESSVFESKLDGPLAIVFGNEARGVSAVIKDAADISIKIPIYGRAESMNVAISAAVCLYEAARQRRSSQGCDGL